MTNFYENNSLAGLSQHAHMTNWAQEQADLTEQIAQDISEQNAENERRQEHRDQVQIQTLEALSQLAELQGQANQRQEQIEEKRQKDAKSAHVQGWIVLAVAAATLFATVVIGLI